MVRKLKFIGQVFWLTISILVAAATAFSAFINPETFVQMSDLLATIIAILIGVSLAISAVLVEPPKVSEAEYPIKHDRERAQRILDKNYTDILEAQKFLFWFYYASLMLAVGFKFIDVSFGGIDNPEFGISIYFKLAAMIFAFVSTFALLWSATLPTLLHKVNTNKMKF